MEDENNNHLKRKRSDNDDDDDNTDFIDHNFAKNKRHTMSNQTNSRNNETNGTSTSTTIISKGRDVQKLEKAKTNWSNVYDITIKCNDKFNSKPNSKGKCVKFQN